MQKSPMNWNVSKTTDMIEKGTISFNNPLQRRPGQWSEKRKSELIRSMLVRFVPHIVCIQNQKDGKNYYDVIDGIQRLTSINSFCKNEFSLVENIKPVKIDGKIYELAGLYFNELDPVVQKEIESYSLNYHLIKWDEETEDEKRESIRELIYCLNDGVKMSKQHLTLISIESEEIKNFIQDIVNNHPLFTIIKVSNKQTLDSDMEMIVIQTIVLLSEKEFRSLSAEHIQLFFEENQIQSFILDKVKTCFDVLYDTFKEPNKFLRKINISSFSYLISLNLNNIEKVKEFILYYSKESKKSDDYKDCTGVGSTKIENVRGRMEGIQKIFGNWVKNPPKPKEPKKEKENKKEEVIEQKETKE